MYSKIKKFVTKLKTKVAGQIEALGGLHVARGPDVAMA